MEQILIGGEPRVAADPAGSRRSGTGGIAAFLERHGAGVVVAIMLLVWSPTALLRMAGGFQIVDYFGSFIDEYLSGDEYLHWHSLIPTLYWNTFGNDFHFRPIWAFIMQAMLIALRGDYSLQFLLKIAASAAVVLLSFATVRQRTGSAVPALLCAVFIIVHPAPVNLYLYTSEAFTQFFLVLAVWWMSVRLNVWDRTGTAIPLAILRNAAPARASGLRSFAIALSGCLIFVGIAGCKEYGFLIAFVICLCLAVFLIRHARAMAAAGGLLILTAALALLSIYRVNQVRDTLIRVVAATPPPTGRAFWLEFGHRLREGLAYLAPVQPDTRLGPVIGVALVGLCVLLLRRIIRALSGRRLTVRRAVDLCLSLEAVLLVSILAVVVLSAVPSGYPPRMSPRYVIPAVAPAAMLLAIAWSECWPKSRAAMLGFAALLLLAAPNITYQRDRDWALYNQAFSTYIDLLKRHQDHGDAVIVDIGGEIGDSIVNFFGPIGKAIFAHDLLPVARAPVAREGAGLLPPPRAAIASQAGPMAFIAADPLAADAVVERIESVRYADYQGSGMDHLVRTWNRIGALLGATAPPYYESATVAPDPGPDFFVYTLCRPGAGIICGTDVRETAHRLGDFCAVLGTGAAQQPAADVTIDRPAAGVTIDRDDGFAAALPLQGAGAGDFELTPGGPFMVERGTLRWRVVDARGLPLVEDWLLPGARAQFFSRSLLLRRGDRRALRADLFAYGGGRVQARVACPSLLTALPVEIVQPAVAYGSFLP